MKAFPIKGYIESGNGLQAEYIVHDGMDLRDYFAAKAMQGIIMHPNGKAGLWEEAAKDAYTLADAMLKARDAK